MTLHCTPRVSLPCPPTLSVSSIPPFRHELDLREGRQHTVAAPAHLRAWCTRQPPCVAPTVSLPLVCPIGAACRESHRLRLSRYACVCIAVCQDVGFYNKYRPVQLICDCLYTVNGVRGSMMSLLKGMSEHYADCPGRLLKAHWSILVSLICILGIQEGSCLLLSRSIDSSSSVLFNTDWLQLSGRNFSTFYLEIPEIRPGTFTMQSRDSTTELYPFRAQS